MESVCVRSSLGGQQQHESNSGMTERDDKTPWLFAQGNEDIVDRNSPHYSEFVEISENFMRGYRLFVDLGFPRETIGRAMLGATINMYTMLDIRQELPALLRKLADSIEQEERLH